MSSKGEKSRLEVRQLEPGDGAAFLKGLQAWEGEDPDWHTFVWEEGMSHDEHLGILEKQFAGIDLEEGKVPHTMLYGFSEGQIVGRCSVRHTLNDFLKKRGGHIGYAVAPGFRRRGFGQQLFKAGRQHIRDLGVRRVFMTCAKGNETSAAMIEKAGGDLQDEVWDDVEKTVLRRYWLSL